MRGLKILPAQPLKTEWKQFGCHHITTEKMTERQNKTLIDVKEYIYQKIASKPCTLKELRKDEKAMIAGRLGLHLCLSDLAEDGLIEFNSKSNMYNKS